MIKANLIDKATGKAFGHVCASRMESIEAYITDKVDVLVGEWQELDPPGRDKVEKIEKANEYIDTFNSLAWTIRGDSPLTPQNRNEWQTWLRDCRKAVANATDARTVKLPPQPKLIYER